jgi:hypothetical protein
VTQGLIRQGDVLLVPCDRIPEGAVPIRRTQRFGRKQGLIIASGEATGHHHRVRSSSARLFQDAGTFYLRAPEAGAVLEHEEHDALELGGGTYRVVRQREYDPPQDPERQLAPSSQWSYVRD